MSIFISHSSRNKSQIREILGQLNLPLEGWIDEKCLIAGQKFEAKIKEAIREAELVLVFLSRDAIASEWVKKEVNWALRREKELTRESGDDYNFVIPILFNKDNVWGGAPFSRLKTRLYVECVGQQKHELSACADQLQDALVKWLVWRIKTRETRANKTLPEVDLSGRWKSSYTWSDVPRKSATAIDEIEIKQTNQRLVGKTVGDAPFHYDFKGKVDRGYVIGNWTSRKLPLFGVFQLRIDIEAGDRVQGYWIGNGTDRTYTGEWLWERDL